MAPTPCSARSVRLLSQTVALRCRVELYETRSSSSYMKYKLN